MDSEMVTRFRDKGIVRRGGAFYLRARFAEEFIEACARARVAILGIELVRIDTHDHVIPDPRFIADFSGPESLANTHEAARKFARVLPTDETAFLSFALAE